MHLSLAGHRGILLMIAGSSIFASNDAFSKLAVMQIPASQVLAVRGVMAVMALLAILVWKGQFTALRFAADRRVLMRGCAEAAVAMLFITSLASLSVADATAILQVVPFTTMVAAVLLFGAKIGRNLWFAVAAGFLGVLLIIKPGSSAFDAMALLTLSAAFLMSFRDFVTARIGAHVPTLVVTTTTAVIGMLIGFAGSVADSWVPLDLTMLLYLAGGGATMIAGHMLTIAAFRATEPATVAPFRYAGVVCSVGISAVVFHDMPDLVSIGGMAIIMGAGLYTMHHHMAAPKLAPAVPPEERPEAV